MKISLKKNRKKFASVKVPVVGGKSSLSMLVKLPRCVEQQVTSTTVSVSKLSSNIFSSQSFQEVQNQNGNTVDYLGLYLFKMVGELQISNFSLFVECISGYSTPNGLDLQLAESFPLSAACARCEQNLSLLTDEASQLADYSQSSLIRDAQLFGINSLLK